MVFAKTPKPKKAFKVVGISLKRSMKRSLRDVCPKKQELLNPIWTNQTHLRFLFVLPPLTRHAVTHYRVLKHNRHRSLVELTLETGRRHQIRVQLSSLGCPIIGDEKYGAKSDPAGRLGLHSSFLRLIHPVTSQELRFTSPLPKPLAKLVS